MFRTLVFHEIRTREELNGELRPISVADGYQDALPLPLFDSTTHFKQIVTFLKAQHYHTLTLDEIKAFYFEGKPLPEKAIFLTFDDCYQSMKKYAYPILKEAGFSATAFVVSGWLFTEKTTYNPALSQTLSRTELESMADVFDYANHTAHFHERKGVTASKSMWASKQAFKQDLLTCNEIVQVKDVFAYPFGLYDTQTIQSLEEMDFCLAFTTKPGFNTLATPKMELHREVISPTMNIEIFQKLLENEE